MNSRQINSFEDLLKWLETERLYDDVAKDIFNIPKERERKEKRRIRRKMGRQQRAIQKYIKINDEKSIMERINNSKQIYYGNTTF